MEGFTVFILMALSVSSAYTMKVEDLINPWPGCPLGPQGPNDDVKLEVADNCNQFIHCESFGRPQLKNCAPSDPALVFDGKQGRCVWPWESNRDCSGTTTQDPCESTTPKPTTPKPTTPKPTTPKPTTPKPTTPKPTTPKPTTPKPTTPKPTTPKPTTPKPTTPKPTTPKPTTPKPTTPKPTTPTPTTTACPIVTCPTIAPVTCPPVTCPDVTCPAVTCPSCPPAEICPPGPNGCDTFFYEHEKSCRKYYECKPEERICPSGLHFNAKLKMCDKPKNAKCSGKKQLFDMMQEKKKDPSILIYSDGSEPFPGCPQEINEGSTAVLLEIKNDCQKYMLCVGDGKGIRKECPADLIFDQKKGVCVFKRDSDRTDC